MKSFCDFTEALNPPRASSPVRRAPSVHLGAKWRISPPRPGAPHEVLLVLDGSTGMNALNQAREFHQAVPLTGLIVTRLDGTSKGGMVVAIQKELGLPIKFIGLGEQPDDLQPFDAKQFAQALFEE